MERSRAKELMDLPGLDGRLLEEDLDNLRLLNRYLGAHRGVLWSLRRLEKPGSGGWCMLDVGTGNGDLPGTIVKWGRDNGIPVCVVAMEPHPLTAAIARRRTEEFPEIAVVRGDGLRPPFSPRSFDFVLASQLLHHFSEDEIVHLLRKWSKLARRGILVSDLVRHPLAYHGISWIARALTRNEMTRSDAPLSVRRAFTLAEWRGLFSRAGIGEFRLFSFFPFRMLGIFSLEGAQ
jgi:SAM-dependent methyltransferase